MPQRKTSLLLLKIRFSSNRFLRRFSSNCLKLATTPFLPPTSVTFLAALSLVLPVTFLTAFSLVLVLPVTLPTAFLVELVLPMTLPTTLSPLPSNLQTGCLTFSGYQKILKILLTVVVLHFTTFHIRVVN
jgi:hypothetical protein